MNTKFPESVRLEQTREDSLPAEILFLRSFHLHSFIDNCALNSSLQKPVFSVDEEGKFLFFLPRFLVNCHSTVEVTSNMPKYQTKTK